MIGIKFVHVDELFHRGGKRPGAGAPRKYKELYEIEIGQRVVTTAKQPTVAMIGKRMRMKLSCRKLEDGRIMVLRRK